VEIAEKHVKGGMPLSTNFDPDKHSKSSPHRMKTVNSEFVDILPWEG
jgi:hypothetical protein